MDSGVDGIRLDAVHALIEDALFRDEPWRNPETADSEHTSGDDLIHIYTIHQPETFQLLHRFRKYVDQKYNKGRGYEK